MKILINAAASLTLASVVLASPVVLADEFDDLRSSSSNMTQEQASNVEAGCGPCIVPIIAAGTRMAVTQISRYGARYAGTTSKQIASNGHSYAKHAGQFGAKTEQQFATQIQHTLSNPTHVKSHQYGTAVYNQNTNSLVLINPTARNGGTAFKPDSGINYFNRSFNK